MICKTINGWHACGVVIAPQLLVNVTTAILRQITMRSHG